MQQKMKNIISKPEDGDIKIIHEEYNVLNINFNKIANDFTDNLDYINYIKRIEKCVRFSKEYSFYLKYIKNPEGLNFNNCAIHSNIKSDKARLELHHGPIFTLFDCAEITMIKHITEKEKGIRSAFIIQEILNDHRDNLIQFVILCRTCHKSCHPKDKINSLFIPIELAFGDIMKYIDKYSKYITKSHIIKIDKYLNKYKEKNKNPHFVENIIKWRDTIKS